MHNYGAKCQAVSLICWWIHGINVAPQSWDLASWVSGGGNVLLTFVNTLDCLFGLCSACRWILPSPCGRASPRGLWGTRRAAISGITLRSGGGTRPSGQMTTPWCWQELLFTTSEEFRYLTYRFLHNSFYRGYRLLRKEELGPNLVNNINKN